MEKVNQLYQIRAAAEDNAEAEILIYDEIGKSLFGDGVSAEELINELKDIAADTIHVRINSVGGQVFEGLAIYNALERHKANVITHVDGLAASIASIIAMAGDEVHIAENAFLMIHEAHGVAIGTATDMVEMAATLEKVGESLVGIYSKRTGRSGAEIATWMAAETWFNAEEALEFGFVDEITDEKAIKAHADVNAYANAPEELKAQTEETEETHTAMELFVASQKLLAETLL